MPPPHHHRRQHRRRRRGGLVHGELTGKRIPTIVTFGSLVGVLTIAVTASLRKERREGTRPQLQEG